MAEHPTGKMNITDSVAILRALDNTGICLFMYYPQEKSIMIPEKTCAVYHTETTYDNMPDSFADDFVHLDDYETFKEMYYKIDKGNKNAYSVFHSKDLNFCCGVTLTTVTWTEDGKPKEVFGIIENISEAYKNKILAQHLQYKLSENVREDDSVQDAINLIANTISGAYLTIFHIWLEDNTYVCFQDDTTNFTDNHGTRTPIVPEQIDRYILEVAEPEYENVLRDFYNIDTLRERLKDVEFISCVYRTKANGWTKAQYIAARRDSAGKVTHIIFTVRDINNEVEREEKKEKAEYELFHDPLTNAYNRKAFDELTKISKENKKPVGFAVLDVDNFKAYNDTYGHEVGDQVLQCVAQCLKDAFRSEDQIFRLGGDEFAILLYGCEEDLWNTFCRKQEYLHRTLHEHFSHVKYITVSIGLCFSPEGYRDCLYELADEALYQTKRNGRSGCTLIDRNHHFVKYWRDEKLILQTEVALDRSTTGVYRMEFPEDPKEAPRMYCNETTKMILGVDVNTTPEQCYLSWVSGIDPSYIDTLKETRQTMIEEGQAECTYLWNHPQWGKIYVRSGGFGGIEDGVKILHGYHHSLKNTKIIEKQDDSKLLFYAISEIYFAAYYLNLENQTYSTFKVAPGESSLQIQDKSIQEIMSEFVQVLVFPADREKMKAFMNLETLQQRFGKDKSLACEYRSERLKGWCRARFIPVKYNEEGKLTHVLFAIASLDAAKAKEMDITDYNKRSLKALFSNVPGGVVLYEWDDKWIKTLCISDVYEKRYGNTLLSEGGENPGGPNFKRVHPDDLCELKKAINHALKETHYLHHTYRIWDQEVNRYLWVRIDATVNPQPEGTSLIYAIYTDVTEQKDAEMMLEKRQASLEAAIDVSNQICCEYDPQTHVMECLTENNFLNMPKIIYNYPESLSEYHLIHPMDYELFLKTTNSVDGSDTVHCDIRCLLDGEYRWYSCTYSPFYDLEKERNIAIFTMYDITLRMEAMSNYEKRLHSLLASKEKSLSMCIINVTKDTFRMVNAEEEMEQFIDETASFETVMLGAADSIVGEEFQKEYRECFSRKALLEQAAKGNMHIQMEYLMHFNENHYEWITAAVDMIQNPVTGDVGGVAYSKSTQIQKMSSALLENTLKQDYLFATIVFVDTDEFYIYNSMQGEFTQRMQNYWEFAIRDAELKCSSETLSQLKYVFEKENIIRNLDTEGQYVFTYDNEYMGKKSRLEIRYNYVDDRRTMILASMRNITDSTLLNQFRHDSEHDPVTDLYNRKTVFRKCRYLLETYPDTQFVMLHVDMKHFRLYNTFFGDEVGDKLLCDVADMFRNMSKDYDDWAYGRIEADVFCTFFPYDQAKYQRHLSEVFEILKNYRTDFLIEPVLGMYFVTDRDMPIEAMFTRATLAAKTVKPSTPNATIIYDEALEQKLNQNQQIIRDMQTAIDEEQFKVYLQPKYSLRTNKMVGAEALVRWLHPTEGLIPPGMFIPVFEGNGFITTLDHYMWEQVCKLLSKWKEEGKSLTPISVNVSRLSMFSTTTVDFLKGLIDKYKIDPKYLELELTESAYIDDPEEMKAHMNALREAGFKILMDDFGSGYSSLNTLRELPVDVLKLDMKFLSLEVQDIRGGLVLSSIVRMSKLLRLVVIAEGVEQQEQADFLKSIGCEYVQGYLFARPMPVSEYEKLLTGCERPIEDVNQSAIGHIGRILAETSSATYAMGTIIPSPLACLEYSKKEFVFLRVNPEFYTEFRISENPEPISKIFKTHITAKSYNRLIQAFEDSISTGEKQQAPILWNCEDGTKRKYACRIAYEGNIGTTASIVVVFTNITEEVRAFLEEDSNE